MPVLSFASASTVCVPARQLPPTSVPPVMRTVGGVKSLTATETPRSVAAPYRSWFGHEPAVHRTLIRTAAAFGIGYVWRALMPLGHQGPGHCQLMYSGPGAPPPSDQAAVCQPASPRNSPSSASDATLAPAGAANVHPASAPNPLEKLPPTLRTTNPGHCGNVASSDGDQLYGTQFWQP